MTTLQMALIGLGPQPGIRLAHTDDDPPSLVLVLPRDDPQVSIWLAALEEGADTLSSDFPVAWIGHQLPDDTDLDEPSAEASDQ